MGLEAFPGTMLKQIRISVVRHAGCFHAIVAFRVPVGGAHQCHRAMDRDKLVAGVPINDHLGIEQVCPALEVGGAVDPHAVARQADEIGMQDRIVRRHIVCDVVMDEAGIEGAEIAQRFG